MIYYHGGSRRKRYFEGWYFKHQTGDCAVAFIPGVNIKDDGSKSAFIQAVTPEFSCDFDYPASQMSADRNHLQIRIGNNIFSESGIKVDLKNDQYTIKGEVNYGDFVRISGDAMGPFRFVPFMQCNHGVISMHHKISGSITIQDRIIRLDGGSGYIETDWGSSFPEKYLWLQTCRDDMPTGIMASIADIPFAGLKFTGCICCVVHEGKEYRLATYNGVRVQKMEKDVVILTQGNYRFVAEANPASFQKLRAPVKGHMDRQIHESVSCRVRTRFFRNDSLLFDFESDKAGYEFVES